MKRQLFLAVDIGTQSTRVALLDGLGKIVASHSIGYELVIPRPGWAQQDPETWWEAAVQGIREVSKSAEVKVGEVLAVCCDAQMHATIPLDPSGKLLSHGVQLWCDKRPSEVVEEFRNHSLICEAVRIAGSPPVEAWVGFKILWLKRNQPGFYDRTWKFVTGASFISYRSLTTSRISWTSSTVAPPGAKPVEVLTKSAPSSIAIRQTRRFCLSVR